MTEFSDLSLDPKVLQAVSEAGYTTPTPIQVQAIPHALEGRDILGIAQTGTGKTAGFVLPMITHLSKGRARARMPRSLVLCPTRELAAQVAENFETYSKHVKLSMALLIGGVSFKDQDKLIDRGVDVLIATPGRLLDHHERGKLMLTGVQIMVVDEADRMLDMGFIPDIERIFKLVPFTRQTLFFSATMAPEITRITTEFLHNPVRVEVAAQATASETIDQYACHIKPQRKDTADREKRDVLRQIIRDEAATLTNGIIFCNRKRDVDVLAKSLKTHGFDAQPLHGDLDQSTRTRILTSFRDRELTLLVASDVAARGLDIPSVSHVFNFDVPIHAEDYVHRIGRTGRAGRWGKSVTLVLPHEIKYLEKIEELVKKPIPAMDNPLAVPEPPLASDAAPAETAETKRSARRTRRRSEPEDAVLETAAEDATDAAPGRTGAQGDARTAAPPPQQGARRRRGGSSSERSGERSGVRGMGDHVPAFLMRELRVEETETPEAETSDAVVEDVPEVVETPKAEKSEAQKPKRTRKPSARKAPATDAGAEEGAADSGAGSDAPETDTAAGAVSGSETTTAKVAPASRTSGGDAEGEQPSEMRAPPSAA